MVTYVYHLSTFLSNVCVAMMNSHILLPKNTTVVTKELVSKIVLKSFAQMETLKSRANYVTINVFKMQNLEFLTSYAKIILNAFQKLKFVKENLCVKIPVILHFVKAKMQLIVPGIGVTNLAEP